MKLKNSHIFIGVLAVVVVLLAVASYGQITGNVVRNNYAAGDVVLHTSEGDIVIDLADNMPITTSNFERLVEEGFYDGIKFHRVIDGFMIQSGDPKSKDDSLKAQWGTGGSDPIPDEFVEGSTNTYGTISMANAGPNTGSSQFFINLNDNVFLDWDKQPLSSKHPAFGVVVEGMDIVEKIGDVETDQRDRPLDNIVILSAELL